MFEVYFNDVKMCSSNVCEEYKICVERSGDVFLPDSECDCVLQSFRTCAVRGLFIICLLQIIGCVSTNVSC